MIRLLSTYGLNLTRLGVPRLMIGFSFASALISALLLPAPWNIAVIALNVAVLLLAVIDMKARDRLAAEHDYLVSQSPEGEFAIVATGHAAETELDALVREHFTEIPDTTTVACRYCDWRSDDFADRLRLAPAHLHQAHPEHDPRVPQLLRSWPSKWLGRLLPPRSPGS
jgi:hypothetical protein